MGSADPKGSLDPLAAYTLALPRHPSTVGVGRRYVLAHALDHPRPDDLALVTSELCTNACEHGMDQDYTLTIADWLDSVWISVANVSAGATPRVIRPRTNSLRRRGLFVVSQLATLTVRRHGTRVRVWAQLPYWSPDA